MPAWTQETLKWSGTADVLFGLPAYDDEGVEYHHPRVENLRNSLPGIHAGLSGYDRLPANFSGIAICSEWEMEPDEWRYVQVNYCKK